MSFFLFWGRVKALANRLLYLGQYWINMDQGTTIDSRGFDAAQSRKKPKTQVFIPTLPAWNSPVRLEYCSGNGEWIAAKALQDKSSSWIGVEMRFDRAKKIYFRRDRENIDNLFVINHEAYQSTKDFIPDNAIDEIFINFPDPWPKRRHAKNRLIQKKFLDEVHRVLKNGCKITFVSDDESYVKAAQNEFQNHRGFVKVEVNSEDYGSSFFERLWKEKGKTIYHLSFQKKEYPSILTLPAGMRSDLSWNSICELAENCDKIFWEFDFAIEQPLDDEPQYLSLQIALDHFKDTVWPKYADKTLGAILYKGPPPQFESEILLDYIKLLIMALPVEIEPFLLFDLTSLSLIDQIKFLSCESMGDFQMALKGSIEELTLFKWEGNHIIPTTTQAAKEAILLPVHKNFLKIEEKIKELKQRRIPFRFCNEQTLNMQWDGLEILHIDESSLSPIGKRMLQGFISAGGKPCLS